MSTPTTSSRAPVACAVLFACTAVITGCRGVAGPPEPLQELPRALSAAERQVISGSNGFAFDLLREVVAQTAPGENVFVSPLSVSMALGMTLNGAAGTTYDAMRTTLGLDGRSEEEINVAYRDLMELLLGLDAATEIRVANSSWARQGFPFVPAFFDAVSVYFNAESRELDFNDAGAPDIINTWVRENTNGRIEDIVDAIPPTTILYLVNAVYFKGEWRTRFDRAETRPMPFYLEGGSPVDVATMSGNIDAGVHHDGSTTIGEFPYGNSAFAMVVAVPGDGETIDDLLASLDDPTWAGWTDGLSYGDQMVHLPRLEMTFEAALKGPLTNMGMGIAFAESAADFSRLTTAAQAFISEVKHKTFLVVDEEGTEAAAATSVEVGVTSAPAGILVDRPFIIAIRERFSGTILFLGLVRDPR